MQTEITPEELHKKLIAGERVMIIDVREPFEYRRRHIPGAVNIPVSRFTIKMPQLPKEPIVTVCEHGHRSETVRNILAKHGYDVLSMEGGMAEWKWEADSGN